MPVKYIRGSRLIYRFVTKVFPEVDDLLDHYVEICTNAGDEDLGKQALSSIAMKRFHAQGGSAYALYPKANMPIAVRFIVSLQTISDYLDNLCDSLGVFDETAFRQLHLSMLDAVEPESEMKDYYLFYPYKSDNDYLKALVEECRLQVKSLPSYGLISDSLKKYIRLYSEMQTYKHLKHDVREKRMKEWAFLHLHSQPEISCWEFSAAAGSTLAVFVLFAAASDPTLTQNQVSLLEAAYFPWICGLHILLDYYIDAREDSWTGELNFTNYYEDLKQCEERIAFFLENSIEKCTNLPYPNFHRTIIKGLLAMYLSDPKALEGLNRVATYNLLRKGGSKTRFYFELCRLMRCLKRI